MTSLLYLGALLLLLLVCIAVTNTRSSVRCPACGTMMRRMANAGWGMTLYICPICKKYFYEDEVG